VAKAQENWSAILEIENTVPESARQQAYRENPRAQAVIAFAHAHTGDFAGAQALIAPSPSDCDDCGIARGQIAELEGLHAQADAWFAQVEKAEPSIPFADTAWGQALVTRGKPDDAIAKFTLANQKGPHFADPLEGWGEALMKQNRSDRALAKFAEAEKYAPDGGRLHLKWGEALVYAGKAGEAKLQFARAALLDLTPADKAELARQSPQA
jgi:tetratricopeptide (TPR) repeat protein